jgi:hypothetical protein
MTQLSSANQKVSAFYSLIFQYAKSILDITKQHQPTIDPTPLASLISALSAYTASLSTPLPIPHIDPQVKYLNTKQKEIEKEWNTFTGDYKSVHGKKDVYNESCREADFLLIQDHVEPRLEDSIVVGTKLMTDVQVNEIIQRMQNEITKKDTRVMLVLYHGVVAREDIEKWCIKVLELEVIEAKDFVTLLVDKGVLEACVKRPSFSSLPQSFASSLAMYLFSD